MKEVYFENYKLFNQDDIIKSKKLGNSLNISDNVSKIMNNWFIELLERHKENINFEQQLVIEEKFYTQFQTITSKHEKSSEKYFLIKSLKYANIINSGFLRSLGLPRLGYLLENRIITELINKKLNFSVDEFISLTEYLKENFFICPNSNLLENCLKLISSNKIFKQTTSNQKGIIIKNICNIIKTKEFHHDIKCYKKIIDLLDNNDEHIINYIKEFEVNNKQGCYNILNKILKNEIINDYWEDFKIKRELIKIFDQARGKSPEENWLKKIGIVENKISAVKLNEIVEIINNEKEKQNHYFNEYTYWSDDVAKRFLKSAKWIIETKTTANIVYKQ